MSLRNTTQLMSSMMNRASGMTFDPVIPTGRPQFNPATGSWVFGLAAFAAGVAVNKMIKTENTGTEKKAKMPSAGHHVFGEGHMRSLLRDTMAEESRSGDYIDNISSEVTRLRDEIAALSAQKEQVRGNGFYPEHHTDEQVEKEFAEVRATLMTLKLEKEKLNQTEHELKEILASQSISSPYAEIAQRQLHEVQSQLAHLKGQQESIQSEYDSSKQNVSDAHLAMDSLQQQLREKTVRLREAELREQSLINDHQVLMETVESLKTQLEFFRNKAAQGSSGVSSLKILEDSNNRLSEQVSSSLRQAEQQQIALKKLSGEKSELANQLENYKLQIQRSEERMSQLGSTLVEAQNAEKELLAEVERLSAESQISGVDLEERARLEDELASARVSIQILESKEQTLLNKLEAAENANSRSDKESKFDQLVSERDALQNALNSRDKNYRDLEASYKEQLDSAKELSGNSKTELVIAAEREEELNDQILTLLKKVQSLENERDLFKSRSELVDLKVTDASNEFMALKQSILTLESEKKSLAVELNRYKNDAQLVSEKLADTQARLHSLDKHEEQYQDEVSFIQENISNNQRLSDNFKAQQTELLEAQQRIKHLIDSHKEKDQELQAAKSELTNVSNQLQALKQRSSQLETVEKSTVDKVGLIQDELSKKDQVISNSQIQEESLRREVSMLRQTTENMESEIHRLNKIQSDLGASSSSLQLLQETEQQLRNQIGQANAEIESQHKKLLQAQQDRVQLEMRQRDESLKLSAIQSENEGLKEQLNKVFQQERKQQDLVSEMGKDQAYLKNLQSENQNQKHILNEIDSQLQKSKSNEQQLLENLRVAEQKLDQVSKERNHLKEELLSVKGELEKVVKERDELQNTCHHLQLNLKDLETRKNSGFFRQSKADKVIPLTVDDAVEIEDSSEYKELDTTVFDESKVYADDSSSTDSNPLFQTTKASSSLRKFKGHRKIEDIEAKEKELDSKIKENLELSQAKELDSEEEGDSKTQKAYSPNRSFSDLLEDNERLKTEQKPVDLEKKWEELDEEEEFDALIEEEKTSIKPLIYGGAAAGILIGSSLGFLYLNGRDAKDTPKKPDQSQHSNTGKTAANSNASNKGLVGPRDNDLTDINLDVEALDLLTQFHAAKDVVSKVKLCRLPNRTLKDMKQYSVTNSQDYKVVDVKVRPDRLEKNGLSFLVAEITGELNGSPVQKIAYFTQSKEGKLLLDWHNYVKFEVAPWTKYLNFDDNKVSQDWHVKLKPEANDHLDFPPEKFASFKVSSWNPDSSGSAYAYLSKESTMYEQLLKAYKDGQEIFILKLSHTGDGSLALVIDEVESLCEFYLSDIDGPVSSNFDEISFDDSSY